MGATWRYLEDASWGSKLTLRNLAKLHTIELPTIQSWHSGGFQLRWQIEIHIEISDLN